MTVTHHPIEGFPLRRLRGTSDRAVVSHNTLVLIT